MIYLATETPTVRIEADLIVLSTVSGSGTVEFALTVHQALVAASRLQKKAAEEMTASNKAASSEIVALPKRRRKSREA